MYLCLIADFACFIECLRDVAINRRRKIETSERRENKGNSQKIDFHQNGGSRVQRVGDIEEVFSD